MSDHHYYLKFEDQPRSGLNSEVCFYYISAYLSGKQSRKKWKKDNKEYILNWKDGKGNDRKSSSFNFRKLSRFVFENGFIDTKPFGLPEYECFWLDKSIDMKINMHVTNEKMSGGLTMHDGTPQQQFGEEYPIKPRLIREGHSFTTLQPQLMSHIVRLRNKLVENSNQALDDSWFFDLRALINDTVSLVEITLNQIYIKAKYDPLEKWDFNMSELGESHGRRFKDKLNWIYKISGNHINAETHLSKFNVLRELRNHLMHFDPPSLIVTIEEAKDWLNYIVDTGLLLVKIREALDVPISTALLNFILQREVMFIPEKHFNKRLPIGIDNSDYQSSTWPNEEE